MLYWKASFQIPPTAEAEACLQLTPRHIFIYPFCSVNGDHRLSNEGVRMSLRPCLHLCICANKSKYRFHKVTARCCNQNGHNHFQSNFPKGSATLHILLQTNKRWGIEKRIDKKTKMKTQMHKDNDKVQLKLCLEKSVVFNKHHWYWQIYSVTQTQQISVKSTDSEWMIWAESGVIGGILMVFVVADMVRFSNAFHATLYCQVAMDHSMVLMIWWSSGSWK